MNHYKWSAAVEQHSWGCEIYEAADLSVEELRRRLDQDGMKRAALKEQVVIMAAKKGQ